VSHAEDILHRAWAVLSPPETSELASYPLDISVARTPCRVALDRSGTRHLLIPTADEEAVTLDPRPSVLRLASRRLAFGGAPTRYIDVACSETDLFPEFDDVAADVLEVVADSDAPAIAAVQVIARWRRLFRAGAAARHLSHEAKLGLFAELSVLVALLEAGPGTTVDMWRGPLREPHDFEAPTRCLEVKGLGPDSDRIVVHGLAQLAGHDARPLDLVLLTVENDPDGTGLDELIDRARAARTPQSLFLSRMVAAGWPATGQLALPSNEDRFTVTRCLRVRVGDGIPRLIPHDLVNGTLAPGIGGLRYQVELPALLPFAEETTLRQLTREAVA
jgi:hypothetical protein